MRLYPGVTELAALKCRRVPRFPCHFSISSTRRTPPPPTPKRKMVIMKTTTRSRKRNYHVSPMKAMMKPLVYYGPHINFDPRICPKKLCEYYCSRPIPRRECPDIPLSAGAPSEHLRVLTLAHRACWCGARAIRLESHALRAIHVGVWQSDVAVLP